MANQNWQVLDADDYPNPAWVPGSLHIGGIGLAIEYLGDGAKTSASFVTVSGERLYRTGDLGRWRADGEIEFLGRADSQVRGARPWRSLIRPKTAIPDPSENCRSR